MSANEADTLTLPGTATLAEAVMFSNRPPPRFLHSSLPPTWLTK
jgi:hypothetical protein